MPLRHHACVRAIAFALPLSVLPAQWTAVSLHPSGFLTTQALATAGGRQAGSWSNGGFVHAALWSGTAASWVDLQPAGTSSSQVLAMGPAVQVGAVNQRAALWHGTAASYVDLNPIGTIASAVRGTNGVFHVGSVRVGIQDHACVWSGESTPPYDLQVLLPVNTTGSYAMAISGTQIAGYFNFNSAAHAVVWQGGTYADLTPPGATGSLAYGVEGGQQVGYVLLGGVNRASLWQGIAASWIDLHPTGQQESRASAVFGGFQVGYTRPSFNRHAAIWNGSAASMVDLHAFAPTSMIDTFATAIWSDGVTLFVAGWGNDSLLSGQPGALLWTRPLGANTLATNTALGQGCGTLRLDATTRPVLGSTWQLEASHAPASTGFGITWLGATDPGIADLAVLGLPGCPLRAQPEFLFGPWLPSSGSSPLPVVLPSGAPALVGIPLFAQAAAFPTPPPNAFGAITSNGVRGTLGDH